MLRYGFDDVFSGQSLYDSYLYQCFNLFYTSLPIIIYAIFDQEFVVEEFLNNFGLYKMGQLSKLLIIIIL